MRPFEVSAKLRQIAATIDNSRNPRRDLVAADLKKIIGNLRVGKFDRTVFDKVKNGIDDLIKKAESQGWESTAEKLNEAKGSLKEDLEALQGKKAPGLRIQV
jgi:hypothetical protein